MKISRQAREKYQLEEEKRKAERMEEWEGVADKLTQSAERQKNTFLDGYPNRLPRCLIPGLR